VDKNKGIDSLVYNALGKVSKIYFHDGRTTTYLYDATGTKLRVKNHPVSASNDSTDYVGGFVYQNVALSFFSSPEGRVVKNGSNLEFQYALTDHQGNTRIIFTSATSSAVTKTATFEASGGDDSEFLNIPTPYSSTAANNTPGGSKVVRMNQSNPIGPAKSVKVYPGDKVDMKVYGYYETTSGYGTTNASSASLITAIASAFGGASGAGGISEKIYNGVNSAIGGFALGPNPGDGSPAAFINYILYDQDYKVLDMGWTRIPATSFTKNEMTISQVTVKEAGYIFVYLSYEDQSNNYVYFDDFQVTHTKSSLIQGNEYYAFGMQTANSWTRENVTGNSFLANGGTEVNQTTQLYDLDFRNFDPVLARMHQADLMQDKYSSMTQYNFSFNNPISLSDPSGAEPCWFCPGGGASDWFAYVNEGGGGGGYSGYGRDAAAAGFVSADAYFRMARIATGINNALNSASGGSVDMYTGTVKYFENDEAAFATGAAYNFRHNSWARTSNGSYEGSVVSYIISKVTGNTPSPAVVREALDRVQSHKFPNLFASINGGPGELELGGRTDATSFNMKSVFDNYYTSANYAETMLFFNPSIFNFRLDIVHISVSKLNIQVNGKGISAGSAMHRMAEVWDEARFDLYDLLKGPDSFTNKHASEVFVDLVREGLAKYFGQGVAIPNGFFWSSGDLTTSNVRIFDNSLFPMRNRN
jgi:RHS repeat-associated protein